MGISLKNLTGAIDPTKKQEDDDKIDDQFEDGTPASTEEDLKIRGGVVIPLLPDGRINYGMAKDII